MARFSFLKPGPWKALREAAAQAAMVAVCTVVLLRLTDTPSQPRTMDGLSRQGLTPLDVGNVQKRLVFYNKPPKTGSTTVRVAMKKAAEAAGLVGVRCFKMTEWNEMAIRTLVNRENVDFYGCHTRLTSDRFASVARMRGGNVTFMTNTRDPTNIVLSSYLQKNRHRDVGAIRDPDAIEAEVQQYQKFVDEYPVDALYKHHGAEVPLTSCPYRLSHRNEMRRIAERYEIVVDLERPIESSELVEVITGLKPQFDQRFNTRTADTSGPMLSRLVSIDTSHRLCGNQLVHDILMQQFNIIKDRLMQNMCFSEAEGSYELCDKVPFSKSAMVKRTRNEASRARRELERM